MAKNLTPDAALDQLTEQLTRFFAKSGSIGLRAEIDELTDEQTAAAAIIFMSSLCYFLDTEREDVIGDTLRIRVGRGEVTVETAALIELFLIAASQARERLSVLLAGKEGRC